MQKEKFALFIDVDRTLTGKNHIIHERTVNGINMARKLDIKCLLTRVAPKGTFPTLS